MSAPGIVEYVSGGSTDAELVAAVRAGDNGAFEELFRRYQPGLARFVRGRVRDHGRAEDVTQEAFVSALRRMRQNDAEIAFRPWVYEIARNATIDLYRRSCRSEELSIDADGGLAQADARGLSADATPDSSVLRRERFDHLRGALDELSETHHRVIVLRELEGRSYREIGECMQLSPAAVESTLFRARRKLEKEYEELDTGRRCRLVGNAIGRLAEGTESDRDRRRLDRHARRCSGCRRRARQLGVEPLLEAPRRRLAARAAAFLPLPAFARLPVNGEGAGVYRTAGSCGPGSVGSAALGPSVEVAAGAASKVVAVIATAAVIGGGGATLGGVGPLAVGGKARVAVERAAAAEPADASPAVREVPDAGGRSAPGPRLDPPAPPERSRAPRAEERRGAPRGPAGELRGSAKRPRHAPAPPAAGTPPTTARRAPTTAPPSSPSAAVPGATGTGPSALPSLPPAAAGVPLTLPALPPVPDVIPAAQSIAGTAARSAEAAARAATGSSAAPPAAGP